MSLCAASIVTLSAYVPAQTRTRSPAAAIVTPSWMLAVSAFGQSARPLSTTIVPALAPWAAGTNASASDAATANRTLAIVPLPTSFGPWADLPCCRHFVHAGWLLSRLRGAPPSGSNLKRRGGNHPLLCVPEAVQRAATRLPSRAPDRHATRDLESTAERRAPC